MTENRRFAVWARILAGLFALAGLIGLAGCGGGSGSPNNVFNTPGDLVVQPAALTAYSMTPTTVTVQGGQPPYQIFSSDQSTLPVQANVDGSTVTLVPNNVNAVTNVTLTVTDKVAASATSAVTINPAPLINSLKLKADAYASNCPDSGGSANPTDDSSVTFICSGQTGSVAVRVANGTGGGLAGRAVRFDIVQGAFQINTELPGQAPTYALTYTVPTDQNGNAVARIRAVPGASQQVAIVQATDVSTGAFVRGTFVIVPVTNANAADLVVIPTHTIFSGPDTQTCSSGVSSTFYVFGGQPPYTVVQSFQGALSLSPSVIPASGGGFTVTTLGRCPFTNDTFSITDSAGHTITATADSQFGTLAPPIRTSPNPITVTPATIKFCSGNTTSIIVSGGGTVSTTGGVATVTPAKAFVLGTDQPNVLNINPTAPTTNPATVQLTVTPPASGGVVQLFVSDGTQSNTLNIPVPSTCP
jgi:hypothetical protein